jgi:hypothetical protein
VAALATSSAKQIARRAIAQNSLSWLERATTLDVAMAGPAWPSAAKKRDRAAAT